MNEQEYTEGGRGGFSLPDGYFGDAARALVNRIEARDELRDYPVLASLRETCPFSVPEGYFADDRLELVRYPSLIELRGSLPLTVPSNYVATAADRLEDAVHAGETPVLAALRRDPPFRAPAGYFDGAGDRVRDLLADRPSARIYRLPVWLNAAAVLVIALGIWYYRHAAPVPAAADCGTIACLERDDLVRARALENADDEDLYELIDPGRLESKLYTPGETPGADSAAESDILFDDI